MTRREFIKKLMLAGAGAFLAPLHSLAKIFPDEVTFSAKDFGSNFTWGVATSAFQTEGTFQEDGKGLSIWDVFPKIKTGENAKTATDFYHKYPEDLRIAKELGFNAFRFSVAWTRIFPEGKGKPNQKGIDFYHRLIDEMLKNNLNPWLTCYHWDLPLKLQEKGGWTNRDTYKYFLEYLETLAKEYGKKVRHWMVLNEPLAFTALGYLLGIHAPGKKGIGKFLKSVLHVSLAQSEGGRILQMLLPMQAKIGSTFSVSPIHTLKNKPSHRKAALRADAFFNRLFLEPTMGLGFPTQELPALKKIHKYMQAGDDARLRFDFHFYGLQYYKRFFVKPCPHLPLLHACIVKDSKITDSELSAMGWEVYPKGIYEILKQISRYPKVKNIVITENGYAFEDKFQQGEIRDTARIKFIREHLRWLLKAKREGVPVGGYFYWSLTDNFEWAEGYRPRFGLVYVDFATQERFMKHSAYWFKEFLEH